MLDLNKILVKENIDHYFENDPQMVVLKKFCGKFKVGQKVYINDKNANKTPFGKGTISGFELNLSNKTFRVAVQLDDPTIFGWSREEYGDPHFYPELVEILSGKK